MVRVDLETRVVSTDNVLSCDLRGEEAILDLESGTYYGLNAVGSAVWRRIREPARLADVVDALTAEYDVERSRCAADVVALVEELIEHGMARAEADNDPDFRQD
jgi:hypothetical protein